MHLLDVPYCLPDFEVILKDVTGFRCHELTIEVTINSCNDIVHFGGLGEEKGQRIAEND